MHGSIRVHQSPLTDHDKALIDKMAIDGYVTSKVVAVLQSTGRVVSYGSVDNRVKYARKRHGVPAPRSVRPDLVRSEAAVRSWKNRKEPEGTPEYVPSHLRRKTFDPEAHRTARHYQGTFEL